MKEYYARPEKDRVIVKPDGDVLLYAFEKYTLGMWQHLNENPKQRRHLYSSLTLLYNVYIRSVVKNKPDSVNSS